MLTIRDLQAEWRAVDEGVTHPVGCFPGTVIIAESKAERASKETFNKPERGSLRAQSKTAVGWDHLFNGETDQSLNEHIAMSSASSKLSVHIPSDSVLKDVLPALLTETGQWQSEDQESVKASCPSSKAPLSRQSDEMTTQITSKQSTRLPPSQVVQSEDADLDRERALMNAEDQLSRACETLVSWELMRRYQMDRLLSEMKCGLGKAPERKNVDDHIRSPTTAIESLFDHNGAKKQASNLEDNCVDAEGALQVMRNKLIELDSFVNTSCVGLTSLEERVKIASGFYE